MKNQFIRCLHLDLKGLPPTASRLLSLLDIMHASGFNAVLVEWEDMFPWTVDRKFRATTAYRETDIKRFAAKARRLGIEIIPLVQCLGHMEMVLRLPKYARLREVAGQNDVMNPLAPGARELVRSMVNDALRLTPDVRYFHLGGDEAWTFGKHNDTAAYIKRHGDSGLYMDYLSPLLTELNARGIRPILWHDMMVHWDTASLKRLGTIADLCVWGYKVYDRVKEPWLHPVDKRDLKNPWPIMAGGGGPITDSLLRRFTSHGVTIWGASAFKAAEHREDVKERAANTRQWAEISARYGLRGVVATGWSRNNSHELQRTPLECNLDLMVCAGLTLNGARDNALKKSEQVLKKLKVWKHFSECAELAGKMEKQRQESWKKIQMLWEYVAEARIDRERRSNVVAEKTYGYLGNHIDALSRLSAAFLKATKNHIQPLWAKRYCDERLMPIIMNREIVRRKLSFQKK
ncbi:MAG: family 20 glycosylhydrolase [Spirochaetes bacterium]|nr:family 20 glycosylhydrolase [Spirochaetota bacterium]